MYISSTNLYLPESNSNVLTSLISSEKYYNCENFFTNSNSDHKKRNLFQKYILNKKS